MEVETWVECAAGKRNMKRKARWRCDRSNLNPTFVTPSIPNTTINNGRQDNVLCHLPIWSSPLLCFADNRHSNVDVLVIGAGPTGLGAAKRLQQIVSAPQNNIGRDEDANWTRMALRG